MQYTAICRAVKIDNFWLKNSDGFLIFAQNKGYENNVYLCKSQFYYIRVGYYIGVLV